MRLVACFLPLRGPLLYRLYRVSLPILVTIIVFVFPVIHAPSPFLSFLARIFLYFNFMGFRAPFVILFLLVSL